MKITKTTIQLWLLMIFAFLSQPAFSQTGENCTVMVNGRIVAFEAVGNRFILRNIPVVADLVRACFICEDSGGTTSYAFTDYFQVRQNQTYLLLDDLVFTNRPIIIRRILVETVVPNSKVLTVLGQNVQLKVTADLSDGTQDDVTIRIKGTVYRTSNPDIATVTRNGRVTAVGKGTVVTTATNAGATSVIQMHVSPGDELTAVEGFVFFDDDTPAANARVQIIELGEFVTTGSDGFFSFTNVPASLVDSFVIGAVRLPSRQGEVTIGSNSGVKPFAGGLTDAGIIKLSTLGNIDNDGDGVNDNLELAYGLDPDDPASNASEDGDADGRPDVYEFLFGTSRVLEDTDGNGVLDVDEDIDRDGLTDIDELLNLGTLFHDHDTDDDGFNDGDELSDNSDPNDPDSLPESLFKGVAIGPSFTVRNIGSQELILGSVFGEGFTAENITNPRLNDQRTIGVTLSVKNITDPQFVEDHQSISRSFTVKNKSSPELIEGKSIGKVFSVEDKAE